MSFMNVRGKVYRCTRCSEHFHVEYEGGVALAQVSDEVISEQIAYTEELGQAGSHEHGLYLYDLIICEPCHAHWVAENPLFDETGRKLMFLAERHEESLNQAARDLEASLRSVSRQELFNVLGQAVIAELSAKSMLPSRKRRRINELFQKWHVAEGLVKTKAKAALANLRASGPLAIDELRKLAAKVSGNDLPFFQMHETWKAENLNPFIITEDTVRTPLPTTPHRTVFRELYVDLRALRSARLNISAVIDRIEGGPRERLKAAAMAAFIDGNAADATAH